MDNLDLAASRAFRHVVCRLRSERATFGTRSIRRKSQMGCRLVAVLGNSNAPVAATLR